MGVSYFIIYTPIIFYEHIPKYIKIDHFLKIPKISIYIIIIFYYYYCKFYKIKKGTNCYNITYRISANKFKY